MASVKQADVLCQLPMLPTPCGSALARFSQCPPGPLLPWLQPAQGHLGMVAAAGGGGNQGWHYPAAPTGKWARSLCALILGKWWGQSPQHWRQTATGVLKYKACPLKLTGLCKDLLHPALRRAIRAERDFATYIGRKQGGREAGEEPSIS